MQLATVVSNSQHTIGVAVWNGSGTVGSATLDVSDCNPPPMVPGLGRVMRSAICGSSSSPIIPSFGLVQLHRFFIRKHRGHFLQDGHGLIELPSRPTSTRRDSVPITLPSFPWAAIVAV